jgi:hypothetical protein
MATVYRVHVYHYPSGRWLEQHDFKKRPDRATDIEALPRLQVPGSYEIGVNRVAGGEESREYSYLKHVDGIWHAGQDDPWPRRCFWIPAEPFDENGWVPSIVIEGEPGHTPLAGNGQCARPWYWGKTYDEARAVCVRENEKTFRLSPGEALTIVMSSIQARS